MMIFDKSYRLALSGVWLVSILSMVLCIGCDRREKPNIILITIDTTRADHLSCYGYPHNTSPHIDRLAEKGVRCDFAIAQSSITPVSCASQLSGTYPYRHELRAMHGQDKTIIRDDVPSLPGELRRLGYRTAAFVSAYPATRRYGFARGFDLFDEEFLEYRRKATINAEGKVITGRSQRTAAETNAKVLPWLRENAGETFFAWIHYFDPHDMHFIPPEPVVSKFIRATREEDEEEYKRSVYDAEIFYSDMQIGQIMEELENLGIRQKTIFLVTSDHGEGLGDHNWWNHGILYQEQIRAPLILNGPGIPGGIVLRSMVEHVDLFPTILEMAKSGSSKDVDGLQGQSILPLLKKNKIYGTKKSSYSEVHNFLILDEEGPGRAQGVIFSLIKDRWKLIHYPLRPAYDQLYDLKVDPREQRNVIATHKEIAATLLAELEEREALDDFLTAPSGLSDQDYHHLKALGYIE